LLRRPNFSAKAEQQLGPYQFYFRATKKPRLMTRRGDKTIALLLIFPKPAPAGLSWNWHLSLKPKFNRLPWRHRASPSTTRYESVKSTDADRLMLSWKLSNNFFEQKPFDQITCKSYKNTVV
jgi:hypothetical protein